MECHNFAAISVEIPPCFNRFVIVVSPCVMLCSSLHSDQKGADLCGHLVFSPLFFSVSVLLVYVSNETCVLVSVDFHVKLHISILIFKPNDCII